MPPDALIFDLDGTLWDTNATCAWAWNRVLERLGIPHREITEADIRAVTGRPHRECVRVVFPDFSDVLVDEICEHTQREDNLAIAERGGALFPGVRELVPALGRRMRLAIVSNCQRGYVELFLESSGLARHFADFECWGNTGRSKASNLRAVIERNRLAAPLFVGDTEGDREAALENRVPFVHAAYGFGSVAACEHRVERFDEIPPLVDSLARRD